jgi:membrane associated rhomboid family serine protease
MSYYDRDYYRPTGFGGFSFFPPVIKKLLIINIAVFFFQQIFNNITFGGVPGWYIINRYFALNPIVGFDRFGEPYNFQIWQLITYQFLHGSFGHIFFNMLMLWMFGMEIENIWGSRKFLVFYLLSGIGGGLTQILFAPLLGDVLAPTIGASAAVFGVMVAFGMMFPNRYIYIYFLVPVKAKYLIAFLILIELMSVSGFTFIAHLAHIGGAVTAAIFILLDRRYHFTFNRMFDFFSSPNKPRVRRRKPKRDFQFRKPPRFQDDEIQEAQFYDITDEARKPDEDLITQEVIDAILDKISKGGYQSLTEREKQILFEASKRKKY